MNASRAIPIISPNAGSPGVLADPLSPESIMKKAKEQEVQGGADMKYDATAPKRVEGFGGDVIVQWETTKREKEITLGLFLASSVLLLLYAAAPEL